MAKTKLTIIVSYFPDLQSHQFTPPRNAKNELYCEEVLNFLLFFTTPQVALLNQISRRSVLFRAGKRKRKMRISLTKHTLLKPGKLAGLSKRQKERCVFNSCVASHQIIDTEDGNAWRQIHTFYQTISVVTEIRTLMPGAFKRQRHDSSCLRRKAPLICCL